MKYKNFIGLVMMVSILSISQVVRAEEKVFGLGEVVVTPTRTAHLLKDTTVSTGVVTKEQIEETGAQNVGEALEKVTGIKVDTYGAMGAATSITLRGSSAKQVLVLVDGRPVNLPSLGSVDLSMYPVDNVERIEVVRGPASALYGANALGGVVNIITRATPEEKTAEIITSYGTFNTSVYRLSYGNKTADFGYLFTGGGNKSDGDRKNNECDGYNFTGKLSYEFSELSRIDFSTGYTRQDKGVPGSTGWLIPYASQNDEKNWLDLSYKSELGERSGIAAKLFFNRHWQEYEDSDIWQDDISKNYQLGLELQQSLLLKEKNLLSWGIAWGRDKVDIKDINGFSKIGGIQRVTAKSIYAQDEIDIIAPLTLVLGGRYDDHSIYGSELSPRVSAICKLREETRLRASVGQAFRGPTVDDLYWNDAYSKGNIDLKPEESIGYDFGIEHQFNSQLLGRLTIFRNEIDDLITWDDPDGDWVWEPYNIDKARTQGIEAEIKAQFSPRICGSLTYTYLEARDRSQIYHNNYLRYKPKHKGGCNLKYENDSGLTISAGLEYTDSVYSDRANTSKLGNYISLSARISQSIGENSELFLIGKNLLDEEYEIYRDYPMPGVDITGGIKVKF